MMSFLTIEGTITATGSSEYNLQGKLYSYIVMTDPNDRRITIQRVFVTSQTDGHLTPGSRATLYFDRITIAFSPAVKHLWGIKCTNGDVCFDRTNVRFSAGCRNILTGLISSLFFIGIPILFAGLFQCLGSGASLIRREQLFYGSDREEQMRLRAREAIRI
jgi:hypothetical protein